MLEISIVICTYERPALLAAALRSVFRLRGLARAKLDVVVIDNSDSGSARPVVEALTVDAPVPVRYGVAHPANISVARNAGVAATTAEIVAFIDDDQELAPQWLEAVVDGLARFPHDAFFGPIAPRFERPDVASPEARAMFTRSSALDAGFEVRALRGRRGQFPLSTANCVLRRSTMLADPSPFDLRLGQSGGEDLHFFCRLERAGRRFAWLPEAAASDDIPARRCGPAYLAARHFVGGQVYAAALVWTSPTPRRDAATILLKALVQLCLVGAALGLARIRRRDAAGLRLRLAGIRGKILWRRLEPFYRHETSGALALASPAAAS